MNIPRRSSMLANNMSSVPENPHNPSASVNPVNGAFQRREARQHMLKAMRAPPLQYAWTFWHDKHSEGGSYEGRLTAMLENIITLKPFWEVYNTFPLDALKMKDSVHFFKRGVRPVWEDPRNVKGGAWTFRVPKDKSGQTWLEILLIAIGEGFADVIQPKDDLCGISYSVRFNSNLITVWNRDGANQKSIDGIRDVILDKISAEIKPREGTFYYKRHSEHAGFNDVVSKAAAEKEAAKEGKIEEAVVTKEEEKKAEEEAEKEEAEAGETGEAA